MGVENFRLFADQGMRHIFCSAALGAVVLFSAAAEAAIVGSFDGTQVLRRQVFTAGDITFFDRFYGSALDPFGIDISGLTRNGERVR